MGYYDNLTPEEREPYLVNGITHRETGDLYAVVYKNGQYKINFFISWLYMPDILIRYHVGEFYMNKDDMICFRFSGDCPEDIKNSLVEYYGNGTQKMLFTNTITGETSSSLT